MHHNPPPKKMHFWQHLPESENVMIENWVTRNVNYVWLFLACIHGPLKISTQVTYMEILRKFNN